MDSVQVPILHASFQYSNIPWTDTLLTPVYLVVASGSVLLLHLVFVWKPVTKLSLRSQSTTSHHNISDANQIPLPTDFKEKIEVHVEKHGGLTIFLFKIARLFGCLTLLALTLATWMMDSKTLSSPLLAVKKWLDLGMCLTYLYTSTLAVISVIAKPRWSTVVILHLNAVLFFTFGVYCYRDVISWAMFEGRVLDISEGYLLWCKISILALTAIIIPLIIPRPYIPVDPKEPMKVPNPEQTASILSLTLYSFLDPIIFHAYRVPRLEYNDLPPLADYDAAEVLKKKSFLHLDVYTGNLKGHLFFGLMRMFRREYMILALMIIIQVMASFASPLGIKQLLHYLETQGKDAVVKPWFWILWLFVGPTIGSIAFQRYIFIATRTLVRAECILTQLVFEHALRIRVKAETPKDNDGQLSLNLPTNSSGSSDHTLRDCESTEGSTSENATLDFQRRDAEENTVHSQEATLRASSSSIKSASKDANDSAKHSKTTNTSDSNTSNLVGKINNLITTDLGNITESRDFLLPLLYIPLQISLCIVFLYAVLGWSALVGLAVALLLFPLPGYVAKLVQTVQTERMKRTDARVESVSETMNVLRMIKLFGWENKMDEKISQKREDELVWIWRRQMLDLLNGTFNYLIPMAIMMITYSTYVLVMKEQLSASKVFSSMTVFEMLRDQMHLIFFAINQMMTGKVSLDRLNDFLHNTELLDAFSEKDSFYHQNQGAEMGNKVGFCAATFTWAKDSLGSLTPSKRKFKLRIEEELVFRPNCVNLIIGPTGSGKTSLLMALLGEMHFAPAQPNSWYNLPRTGGVAYAAQESWVQNETIKENILFGSPFNEERYKKVVYQCCLERDLDLFDARDDTEVGEKGLTLSGGQKARITLARAVYSQAAVLLLDDILAALDVHTSKWIVDKCLAGDLIKGRTVLLVTHNVALARSVAGYVVSLSSDGRIADQGTLDAINDTKIADVIKEDQKAIEERIDEEENTSTEPEPRKDGKLILSEETEEGHVDWKALKLYFNGLGGNHTVLFFITLTLGLIFTEVGGVVQTWYLGHWASQYDEYDDPLDVPVFHYLGVYGSLLLASLITYGLSNIFFVLGTLRASRSIHKQLVESVLGTTLRWLDTTPTARVITRCTQDIRAVDGPISNGFWWLSEVTVYMLSRFGAVVLFTPVFIGPGILVAILGGWVGQIYIAAQLSIKREMSNAKAPVLGHFGAAIAGLTSIRAYGAQQAFVEKSLDRINRYTRSARTFYNLNRWVCIRIDTLGGLFAASLGIYLVYFQSHSASNTGFSLNMAVGFSGMILWWVRILNDFEVQGNSLERIQQYIQIEQEPKPTEVGKPPAYWPSSGNLRVENLSARYSSDGAKVLHGLSFEIQAGERIGVVGRTGSGKSSLTLAILRCIFTEGNVYYDGLHTDKINLDALRSSITIIPQTPELLSGTLRQNLDPFDQYDDATLNEALRSAGLFALQNQDDEGRITLDSSISSGGSNLSVGQRQILALARAIVRDSKLLILDEATSAIDHKTDSVIQSSLRHELGGGTTVITVAHRLHTIMDADKIMVLDAGQIVEFDSPKILLEKEKGKFRALVDESGDKEILYAIAQGER